MLNRLCLLASLLCLSPIACKRYDESSQAKGKLTSFASALVKKLLGIQICDENSRCSAGECQKKEKELSRLTFETVGEHGVLELSDLSLVATSMMVDRNGDNSATLERLNVGAWVEGEGENATISLKHENPARLVSEIVPDLMREQGRSFSAEVTGKNGETYVSEFQALAMDVMAEGVPEAVRSTAVAEYYVGAKLEGGGNQFGAGELYAMSVELDGESLVRDKNKNFLDPTAEHRREQLERTVQEAQARASSVPGGADQLAKLEANAGAALATKALAMEAAGQTAQAEALTASLSRTIGSGNPGFGPTIVNLTARAKGLRDAASEGQEGNGFVDISKGRGLTEESLAAVTQAKGADDAKLAEKIKQALAETTKGPFEELRKVTVGGPEGQREANRLQAVEEALKNRAQGRLRLEAGKRL